MMREPLSRPPIYTIGHGSHERATFLSLLTRHGVNMLIDVRSHPVSRYMPHFSKEALEKSLQSWGVAYLFLGRELGGRRSISGVEDAVSFARGVDRIMEAWGQGYRLALFCAEEDPRHCHRAGRIAPSLLCRGGLVIHIRGDGRLEPHTPAWGNSALDCLPFEEPS